MLRQSRPCSLLRRTHEVGRKGRARDDLGRHCGDGPGNTHRLRAGVASAQCSSRRSRRRWLGPPVGSPSSGDTATQRSVADRVRAPSASKSELLHRRVRTLLQVQLCRSVSSRSPPSTGCRQAWRGCRGRLPHDEDLVVRARLAGVGHERGVEVQARAEAGHVDAVELGLIERVCKLDEGWLRLRLCRRRFGGGWGRLRVGAGEVTVGAGVAAAVGGGDGSCAGVGVSQAARANAQSATATRPAR